MKFNLRSRTQLTAVGVTGLTVFCTACGPSSRQLADRARAAATAQEWRTWAAQMIQYASTNSEAVPPQRWPPFVQRCLAGRSTWQVLVQPATNRQPVVSLVSLGGFDGIGIDIGPPNYVEISSTDERC